eukprot:c3329_g1_i1 orf=257-1417(+)
MGHEANELPDYLVEVGLLDEEKDAVRVITLNRPRKLNCITLPMVVKLGELYEKWESDDTVQLIIIKAVGRAFCAGGDLRMFYHYGKKEDGFCREVVYRKYWLDYHLHSFKKPMVAILHGLVIGGGAGLTVPCQFRVVTEKTAFAMPEAPIGYHTDVGASYFLPQLPGYLGEYLATTGARIDGADMLHSGLATHFVQFEKLPELERCLMELNCGDENAIRTTIEEFSSHVELGEKSILHSLNVVDKIFSKNSLEEILEALVAESESGNLGWIEESIQVIRRASPTGVKMTFRSIREGRMQSLAECLKKEFRLTMYTLAGVVSDDLYEGIRALVIDKDNAPKWNPPSLQEVTLEKLQLLFQPFEDQSFELQLPEEGKNLPRWGGKYVS